MIPVRCGNAIVRVYPPVTRSDGRWTIAYCLPDGSRKMESRATEKEAIDRASILAQKIHSGRIGETQITQAELDEYRHAVSQCKGVPLSVVIKEWLAFKERDGFKPVTCNIAVSEFIQGKKRTGASSTYLRWIESYLSKWSEENSTRAIGSFTTDELELWLDGQGRSGRSRINNRGAFITLWRWASKRGYVPKGSTVAEDLARPLVTSGDIEPFTVEELKAMLKGATPSDRLYIAIRGFAGVRDAEICRDDKHRRLSWSDILWDQGLIQVTAAKAKTRSRRVIPIEPNLAAWLDPHRGKTGPIITDSARSIWERLGEILKRSGHHWKKNGLRRAYASYLYAREENEHIVSARTGHSPAMLFQHYRGVVTKRQAQEWFSITPEVVTS